MNPYHLIQYGVFLVVLLLCVKPVGIYLYRVFEGKPTALDFLLRPVERLLYRLLRVNPANEMTWRDYTLAFIVFTLCAAGWLFALLMVQSLLPEHNPALLTTPMTPDLALNTAISFSTGTTWQAYGGETTLTYLSQALGLVSQNFFAGGAGLAVGIAFIRGLAREQGTTLGNFWVDLTRAILWVLLPLSVLVALLLVWQGVPLNLNPYTQAATVQGETQTLPQGPIAALESIKNLGTNGGGYFNTNAAHPYENPTPLTNMIELWSIVVLPAALTYTFGRMIGRTSQGWFLLAVMTLLFVVGLGITGLAEQQGNPRITALGVDSTLSTAQPGGNMEGKEVRFGIHGSALAAVTTSNGATGSYNSMHDSYTPLGGMVPLVNMLLGELIYGGVGTGIYSMVMLVLISVFISGLMIGRSPEYLGKPVSVDEIKLVGLYLILSAAVILPLTALAVLLPAGRAGLVTNQGAHGFTEIFYAYTSSFANNGQNFAGLNANSVFYNLTTALAMLAGRIGLATLALALAGLFVQQRCRPPSSGMLPTDGFTFGVVLIAVIFIVGALSFFPALALGPLVEQLRLY
ncbi:MAG: potassium-transporting ATPase subunit KdpA [bacterium]|nr:potassium-transporting ATPase subunit KdpA [bacterium]